MSAWSLLLRLLLAVALVFNGVAPAVAAVHAGHMAAPAAVVTPVPVADEAMPCHEHHQAGAAEQPQSAPVEEAPASPDCCESGACRCACVHSTPVAIIDLGFVAPVIEHVESVRPMPSGHADAALPHLIRPPIG